MIPRIVFIDTDVVNGTTIETEVSFEEKRKRNTFPVLYKIDKIGHLSWWKIYVVDNELYRESAIDGGKIKTYDPVICIPKNVGRSNETSPHEQALFEAFSHWKKKRDQLYTEEKPTNSVDSGKVGIRPMLAQEYKKNVPFPCGLSPKLDGVRCLAYLQGDKVILLSRGGKEFNFLDEIRKSVREILFKLPAGTILDGELYSHAITFNVLSGIARSKTKPNPSEGFVSYHIFDLIFEGSPKAPFKVRHGALADAIEITKKDSSRIHLVEYELGDSHEDIIGAHDKFVSQGYEGLIIRNLESPYAIGRRVKDLQKYKTFKDEEFPIINITTGVGSEKDAIIFVCKSPHGEFMVRPRGTIEERREQYKGGAKTFIGKKLTVRYQPQKEDAIPRFPIGICIRDYE